jgi:hypothetical protein
MSETKQPEKKSPYEPPKVLAVKLRPEEAVLGTCKIAGGAGPIARSCTGPSGRCSAFGS